jgi:hypothetical protein
MLIYWTKNTIKKEEVVLEASEEVGPEESVE